LKLDEIRHLAARALEHKHLLHENRELRSRLEPDDGWGEMIGISPRIKEVFGMISKVAPLDCNILIQGDSGTGKELVARSVHQQSRRKDRPFIAFNCAGFAEELIASELFGYQRGAFTGATATKIGILETADGGTVFMDEIGDMPLSMQGKLLRVIQERQILRVGANKPIQLDLRFIAATNKDLKRAILEGRFREDLYFRLNVVQIALPNLMDRKEDIPILIRRFIEKYSWKFSKNIRAIDSAAEEVLLGYTYPGNVRELENIIERAVALAEAPTLTVSDLPPDLREYSVTTYGKWLTWEEREQEYLRKVLEHTRHDLRQTARILNLPRTTLWRKMKKYGLRTPRSKSLSR
jgi:DNA-binding NtrC family response regulator